MISDNEIKKTISDISALFPVHSREERTFLKNLKTSMGDYSEIHPEATKKELIDHFGEPVDIVRSYIGSMDIDSIIKKVSIRKTLQRVLAVILICAIIGLGLFSGFTYRAYRDYKNTIINEVETDVE